MKAFPFILIQKIQQLFYSVLYPQILELHVLQIHIFNTTTVQQQQQTIKGKDVGKKIGICKTS